MSDFPRDAGFVEIGDRCWVARFEFLDVNVGVVGGDGGVLVVDTHASEVEARRVVEQVRRLGAGEVVAVVNTHDHFDHCFGNIVFAGEYDGVRFLAHEDAVAGMRESAPRMRAEAQGYADDPRTPEDRDPAMRQRHRDIAATRLHLPEESFASARVVDLGDRLVEVVHPGRGHTAGDAVVRVGGTNVLFAGDLVEESAVRSGVPGFGADCFPLDWPASLDIVVGMLPGDAVVVPGHGRPVDRDFVEEQRNAIAVVAGTIRDLAGRGVAVDDALAAAEWPYPSEELGQAVRRGYAQLPRGARSLPLL